MRNYSSLLTLAAAVLWSSHAHAGDSWGLENEKVVQADVTVVDLLCEISSKQCVKNCGDGKRQLGLKFANGQIYPALKSITPFAGLTVDLLPYCGKTVTVDGLQVDNPAMHMFAVQRLRADANSPWIDSDAYGKQSVAKNGPAEEWYRIEPDVTSRIEANGVFGIKGLQVKKADEKK